MRTSLLFALATLLVLSSCKQESGKFFRLEAYAPPLKTGETTEGRIRIVPQGGYKWNTDYRASASLNPPPFLDLEKKSLDSKSEGIFEENGSGVVKFTFKGIATGKGSIQAVLSFSVCDEEVCKIFKGEKTDIPVEVF